MSKKFPRLSKRLIVIPMVCLLVMAGLVTLMAVRGAGPSYVDEPEYGNKLAPAVTVPDTTASNGSAVRFGTGTSNVMRFNLSTWNAHADVNSLGAANQLKTQIFNVTDVVGLQEFSDKTALDEVRALLLCATCGYDSTITTYTWEGSSPNKVLIVWKKSKFTKVTSGIQNATPPATVNDSTSATVPAKFNVWVKLRENSTGKQFYLINTHFLNGVESGGRPRTENGARLTLYYTHMTKSLELINQLKADNIPIFMTGDFNVNYKYDKDIRSPGFPYVKFPTVGARSTYQILNYTGLSADPGTNSSGDRLIDYIVHVTRPDVTIRSQAISPTQYGSDHYMYTNAIELR